MVHVLCTYIPDDSTYIYIIPEGAMYKYTRWHFVQIYQMVSVQIDEMVLCTNRPYGTCTMYKNTRWHYVQIHHMVPCTNTPDGSMYRCTRWYNVRKYFDRVMSLFGLGFLQKILLAIYGWHPHVLLLFGTLRFYIFYCIVFVIT